MISKSDATAVVTAAALQSLMERAGKMEPSDVKLYSGLWRLSFKTHTDFVRPNIEKLAVIIGYGNEPQKFEDEEIQKEHEYNVNNSAKWFDKWEIDPETTAKLKAEAAKKKAAEEEVEKKETEEKETKKKETKKTKTETK